jgi:hypothetical protein
MSATSEGDANSDLTIYAAKCIINEHCRVYNNTVLNTIKVGHVVRIGYKTDHDFEGVWGHDNPHVKIIDIDYTYNILGEIMDINRIKCNKYPLNIGDRIMFVKSNIYEIPYRYNIDYKTELRKHITESKVPCTGPLFFVEYPNDSSSDGSSDESMSTSASSSVSDSD